MVSTRIALAGAAWLMMGCVTAASGPWAASVTDGDQARLLAKLPPEAQAALIPVTDIFYTRIVSRRFDSRASFEDPSLREFFDSVAAYSDYYAGFVDALSRAHVEFHRPTSVELLALEPGQDGHLLLELRFVGENDLPLRFWKTQLRRTDEWRWDGGRWWVVPGKL